MFEWVKTRMHEQRSYEALLFLGVSVTCYLVLRTDIATATATGLTVSNFFKLVTPDAEH